MNKVIASAVLLFFMSALSAFASPVSFQGSLAIEDATQPCIDDGFSKGTYLTVVYSYANGTSGDSDALAIFAGRSTFRIISTDASGTLSGPVANRDIFINSRAALFSYTSTSNLQISTVGGNPLSTGVNLKILGTINDAFVSGCTITVHALLVVRPIQ